MFQVDQFESVFRSALHDPFELQLPTAESLLVVTDLAQGEADALAGRVAAFLGTTSLCDAPAVRAVNGEAFSSTTELLELVDKFAACVMASPRKAFGCNVTGESAFAGQHRWMGCAAGGNHGQRFGLTDILLLYQVV